MSDVFISYARSTEAQARAMAEALRAQGYGVWRDDELPAHRDYSDVIEERLRAAKAVVVVWSAEAVKSQWVRAEADIAREAGTLVQLSLDGAVPPLPFNRVQCADMNAWSGDLAAPGWIKVAASIADLVRADQVRSARSAFPGSGPAEPLLAVLAFDNLSADPEMTYFSDGVSEEIQETVARGSALKVIGKASSFQFRGADKAASHVGAALRATHILDGSVRRSGQRVRIAAQLVECARSTTLWSERFDRDLTDIFALQDEIAAEVAAALKTAFAPTGAARSVDPGAYDLYLKARNEATLLGAAERVEMLARAVTLAPDFALAWAELANWRFELVQLERGRPAFAPGLDAVRGALEAAESLDPALGVTRFWRALIEPYAAYARREALCREALRLTPGDARCVGGMGRFLGYVGRRREALALAEEAAARDPLSPTPASNCLWLSDEDYQTRMARYDASRIRWPVELRFNTVFAAWLTAGAGEWANYEALARRARSQLAAEAEARVIRETLQFCEALRDGDDAYFDGLVGEMEASLTRGGTVRLDTAARAAQAGRIEQAFAALARASFDAAFEPGGGFGSGLLGGWSAGVLFDMVLNGAMIRDPRFVRLCAKLGLVGYWLESGSWPDCADAVPYDFRAEARRQRPGGFSSSVG